MPRRWWPFTTTPTPGARATQASARKSRNLHFLVVIVAGVLLAAGLWGTLSLWLPGSRSELEVGRPSPMTIQAPRSTEFESALRTAEAQAQAENRPENVVYTTNRNLPIEQRVQLIDLFTTISNIRNDPSLSSFEKHEELIGMPSASVVLSDTLASTILSLDDSTWSAIRGQTLNIYDRALSEYDYEIDEDDITQVQEHSLPLWTSGLPQVQRDLVLLLTRSFLRVNHTFDPEATARQKRAAREAVQPVIVRIQAGQSLVRDGEIVTPEVIEMLEATGALPRRLTGLDMGGYGLIATVLSVIIMLYLGCQQPELIRQPRALFVIVGLLIATAFSARLLLALWPDYPYAFPMATIVLVLAIVFNSHLALASAALLSVVIGMLGGNSLPLTTTMLASSMVAVFSVRTAERPLTFMQAGVAIALATMFSETGFWLINTTDPSWGRVQTFAFFSAINGLLSAILALGLFNIVGHIAGIVTPLQLMELAHPSQPLIRKVVREAPGTYYHSVSVGNLAEAAAEAVGADALLLRVAAYYHDIGKTIRPYFFTDNQTGRENVHNDLDPQTSATIIIDHVREGVKMAQAARLPQQIIDFIATHHGTSIVSHFYQVAMRDQDMVDIDDFRYPGPKPFTREQGIMMLADSVEATVRAKAQHGLLLARPANGNSANGQARGGAQTIDDLVGSIIDERVRSGQLDNTALTLHDLVLIREAFVSSLQGIYHPRVDYAPQIVKS